MSCFLNTNEQAKDDLRRLTNRKQAEEPILSALEPLCIQHKSKKDVEEQKEIDEIENILKFEHVLQRSRIQSFNDNYKVNLYECSKKVEEMLSEITLVIMKSSALKKKQNEIDLRRFLSISNIIHSQFKSIISILKIQDNMENEDLLNPQEQEVLGVKQILNEGPKQELEFLSLHNNGLQTQDPTLTISIKQQNEKKITNSHLKEIIEPKMVEELKDPRDRLDPLLIDINERQIEGSGGINKRYLCLVITIIVPYIDLCIECLKCLRSEVSQKRSMKSYMNDIRIYESKMNTISEFMPYALLIQKDDIFDCDIETDPTWQLLKSTSIDYIQIASSVEIAKSLNKIHKAVMLGNAMAAKGAERTSLAGQWLQRNLSSLYYLCNPKTTQRKATIFYSQPDPKTAIMVWNLVDDTFVQHALKMVLPSTKYTCKIFVPKSKLRFTKETILAGVKAGNLNSITPSEQLSQADESLTLTGRSYKEQRKSLFQYSQGKVKVRILCSSELKPPSKDQSIFKSVVIHIHGGGFVAMGSKSHQMYTRQWANILNIPVFSIDYAKAPENPYPQALDDCFQVYQWILNHSSQYFNMIPEKIILVGDSAGGNLSTALTLLCIKYNIRVPHGVLALYPVLNLDLKAFTPSYFLALEDLILPHMFLKITLNAYLSDPEIKNMAGIDPFISPLIASDQILSKFPPLRIQSGTNDPLSDHSFRFLHRLRSLGNDARLVVYNDMPHGYMNYDAPGGMKEARQCVLDAAESMKQFLARD